MREGEERGGGFCPLRRPGGRATGAAQPRPHEGGRTNGHERRGKSRGGSDATGCSHGRRDCPRGTDRRRRTEGSDWRGSGRACWRRASLSAHVRGGAAHRRPGGNRLGRRAHHRSSGGPRRRSMHVLRSAGRDCYGHPHRSHWRRRPGADPDRRRGGPNPNRGARTDPDRWSGGSGEASFVRRGVPRSAGRPCGVC